MTEDKSPGTLADPNYNAEGIFVGEHGSPAYKAHVERLKHGQEVYDACEALLVRHNHDAPLDDLADAVRTLEYTREESPAAYAEACDAYQKAAADAGLVALKAKRRPLSPDDSRVGDVFTKAPPAPSFVVDRLLPRAHGVENAPGGAGKTTRHLWEAVHLILGRELYGCRVLQPGPVLFVSAEDGRELFEHRLHGVVAAFPDLTAADRHRIAEHLHVLILTGTGEKLVTADRSGNLTPTDLAERIITGYSAEGLALVEFDPLNLFSAGERFTNDSEAATLSAMARISLALKCTVRATSHVSKAVARGGISDAHSGRGGSALGDNSRFVWNFAAHDLEAKREKRIPPPEFMAAAQTGDLSALHFAKLTAARPAYDRIWVRRAGFAFDWKPDVLVTRAEKAHTAATADDLRVMDYLRRAMTEGRSYTSRSLTAESTSVGVPEKRIRSSVVRLTNRGQIIEKDLPAEHRQGSRRTYLDPVAPAPLDTGRTVAEQI